METPSSMRVAASPGQDADLENSGRSTTRNESHPSKSKRFHALARESLGTNGPARSVLIAARMLCRLLSLLVVIVGLPAAAYDLRIDASGTVVRWKGNVEFVLDAQAGIQLNVAKVETAARAAIATLAAVTPDVRLTMRVGTPRALGYEVADPSKNQNDIIVLKDWPYSDGALAATVVTVNGKTHEIVDADIAFNTSNNAFAVLDGPQDTRFLNDVQNTLTHELGHAMGLLHNATDAKVVMYPSAPAGEVTKRVLAADDSEALRVLYAASSAGANDALVGEPPMAQGCSASMGELSMFALAAVMSVLSRKRRSVLALAAMPVMALAAPASELDLSKADDVAVGSVVSAKSENRSGQFVTELKVNITHCAKGGCAATVFVTVPGGKVGDYEQFVIDHPVPVVGESLAVSRAAGHQLVLRLAEPENAAKFERALKTLRGSVQPHSVSSAPPASVQPVVKSR